MNLEYFLPIAAGVAKNIARDYPPVEADDVYGELCLKLVEEWPSFQKVLDRDDVPETSRRKYVREALVRRAVGYARKERNARLNIDDQYYYLVDDIRDALPAWFDQQDWTSAPTPEDGDAVKRWDPLDIMADISRAFYELPPGQQQALSDAYNPNRPEIDESEALRKRASRAVNALSRKMNRRAAIAPDYEGPGSRQAVSNAEARYMTSNEYVGRI